MLHPRFSNVEEKNTSDLDRPLGPSTRGTMMDFINRTSVLKTRRIPIRLQPPGQLLYIICTVQTAARWCFKPMHCTYIYIFIYSIGINVDIHQPGVYSQDARA